MNRKLLIISLLALLMGCTTLTALTAPNPQTAFQPSGFGVMVSTDRHTYTRPIIKMSLTVFNYTPDPITFTFTSAQFYDFTIYNSSGIRVWRWSDGRKFESVMKGLTLKPNETVTYSAVYQSKTMLNEDLYTLKGELTNFDMRLVKSRVMEGTVSFWAYLTK